MTEQTKDTVVINQIEYQTFSIPLGYKENLDYKYTSCYRGYVAQWEIKNQQLWLIGDSSEENLEPKLASWFSGDVVIPGDVINQPNIIYSASNTIIEESSQIKVHTYFKFKEGILIGTEFRPAPLSKKRWWQFT